MNYVLLREVPELAMPPQIGLGEYGKPFLAEQGAPAIGLAHSGEYAAWSIGHNEVRVRI